MTRFFSLVLALALVSIPANAYVIPRATVDYRRHDVNVRIVEETRSIPSVVSYPRLVARRRGVRDFRVPNRLRTRQALPQPGLGDIPDVEPILPKEERSSGHAHAVPNSSTASDPRRVAPRDITLSYPSAVPTLFPRNAAGLVQLDLLNTYYREMRTQSRNLRTSPPPARTLSPLMISHQETTAAVLATRGTTLGFVTTLLESYGVLGTTWIERRAFLEISVVTRA